MHCEHSGSPAPDDNTNEEADSRAARSEKNILTWMEYLPRDCIETMIRMGWDEST